ncbi:MULTISPECIES: shikimate kinase [Sphingobacterium]|uniref:Shikimate kinase n=1 Tax=Sphingobacterium cellulitidis TaxID=1768011 RepID=A0A8H9KVN3_9SPHI|nr:MULTISPECIES: shikimate kinase [Sphingobacterium]MBA8988416.1 shikimate kinase [Sphingobacterium soli]WFB62737.1 shikimate kinase [Sphingobacterium sp. WM]GGE32999.1 shikimate kinase [Sphingobacterium soli]
MIQKPVFLIGFMGSGKTTWGKKLANALQVPFVDLDHEIVEQIGMSIPEYFSKYGEEKFRELEREVLIAQQNKSGIISTGGGTPCYFQNMDWLLDNGIVLYLKHSPKSLWNRLNQSDINKRPALKGMTGDHLLQFIESKLEERAPFYDRAHILVDQLNTNLEELVSLVKANIELYEQ